MVSNGEEAEKPVEEVKTKDEAVKPKLELEQSNVTPGELEEIEAGDYMSCKQIATQLGYTTTWISTKCKMGQIKSVKPVGGQYRIPKSEYDRMRSQGFPIQPQPRPKPKVESIEIKNEQLDKVAPEIKRKERKQEKETPANEPFKLELDIPNPFEFLFKKEEE